MASAKQKKPAKTPLKKIAITVAIAAFSIALFFGIRLYTRVLMPNVDLGGKKSAHILIPTGSDYNAVAAIFRQSGYIKNFNTFESYAEKKGYAQKVKPGRYKLVAGMSNRRLLNMLISGNQDPAQIYINNIRTKEKLASILGKQLEPDSLAIVTMLNSDSVAKSIGMTPETIISLFIPNTYELYWNVTPNDILKRMKKEYDKFWGEKNRQHKADSMGLSREQVITVASIVDEETNYVPEMNTIAGVYLNRLKKEMLLQADPTVKFAIGDPTIRRILNKHLSFDSPYNTYKYKGLPPGPIALPSIEAIDAVLNSAKTPYIYFCAKADFSGAHAFAVTKEEHEKNAQVYQAALNKRNIKK
ncbi:endolytic transglycosylase MltG [uncultured Acetobacteroides sp.]|uniref:endolytic transglycosylase MltG n=1 Tax=uncultured Acetobacteroides sp. TaxID=1760811 RepID=UPI0029F4DE64|nr:endolytic transglycosylase MltG [uncultured Acetobacteroides sp.]